MILGVLVEPFGGQHRLDDFVHHRLVQRRLADVRGMLGGQDHRFDPHRLVVFVAEGDLALGVRPQPGQGAVLAHLGLAPDQAVGVGDRRRHQHFGLVTGVAEHQALIAGALFLAGLAIHALVDVVGLFPQRIQHCAGMAIEADVRMRVADVVDGVAHQLFIVDPRLGGDFTGQHYHAGLDQGFAGDPRMGILVDDGVQNRIGNLVGHLVGMTLGDRFGCKQKITHSRCTSKIKNPHGRQAQAGFTKIRQASL